MHKELSNLEQEIMQIVWDKRQVSVRDVMNEIASKKKLAYNTIATILQRLEHKGFVVKKESAVSHIYMPAISQSAYTKGIVDSFLQKCLASFGKMAISSFAESIEKLPEEQKKDLLRLLDTYEKNK